MVENIKHLLVAQLFGTQRDNLRKRSAFMMTDTELKLIAAAAMIGESNRPKNG